MDLTNPKITLELLRAKSITDQDIRKLMVLTTTPKLLRKLGIDSLDMVSALKKARVRQKPNDKEMRLQYDLIVGNLDSLTTFLDTIKKNAGMLSQDLAASLGNYFPPKTDREVTIYGMMGGWSTGYTFGEPDEFFVLLQKLEFDYNVFYATTEHELFHNVQSANYNENSFLTRLNDSGLKGDLTAMLLLTDLWQEGSASYIANAEKYVQTPGIITSFKSFQENENRMYQLDFLFDRMLVDAYHQPDPDYDRMYGLFFSSNWNELGYYLGYRMIKRLADGKSEEEKVSMIKRYLKAYPTQFVMDYIALTKAEKEKHGYYQFSAEFEKIVQRLNFMIKEKSVK